jgi:hypothetical protein
MRLAHHHIEKRLAAGARELTMTCPEREQLLQAYHQAVAAYANAVSELKHANRDQFPRQFAMADAAREKCDRLREKIDLHRVTHGC